MGETEESGGEVFAKEIIKQSVEVGKLASRFDGGQLRVSRKC